MSGLWYLDTCGCATNYDIGEDGKPINLVPVQLCPKHASIEEAVHDNMEAAKCQGE